MKDEGALVRIFFLPSRATARKFDQAEAVIAEAPEAARWRLRRLLAACEIVHAALLGRHPPTRWEVIPVRSRKQRAARVERAKARAEVGQENVEPSGHFPTPLVPRAVELPDPAPVVAPAPTTVAVAPAPVPAPAPGRPMACPRCGSTKLVRVFALVWACETCGFQLKKGLPGVAP